MKPETLFRKVSVKERTPDTCGEFYDTNVGLEMLDEDGTFAPNVIWWLEEIPAPSSPHPLPEDKLPEGEIDPYALLAKKEKFFSEPYRGRVVTSISTGDAIALMKEYAQQYHRQQIEKVLPTKGEMMHRMDEYGKNVYAVTSDISCEYSARSAFIKCYQWTLNEIRNRLDKLK